MRKIRILVVDDSTVIRRLLSDSLNSDPGLEVAATAPNGRIALAKIPQVNPDVVTLDMEMPEMDGLATLVELRKTYPRLPVIMFSTLTQRGAESTLEALAKGASDYVTKPANVGSVTAALENVRSQLIPKIKGFCPWSQTVDSTQKAEGSPTAAVGGQKAEIDRTSLPTPYRLPPANAGLRPTNASKASRIDIVAIGISTGGPNALATVLSSLPASLPVPVVIVQHMPPIFTKHLANRLNQLSPLEVKEAAAGDVLHPGGVWIAPGDYHLVVEGSRQRAVGIRQNADCDPLPPASCLPPTHAGYSLRTQQEPPENSCRPAVDVLFRSVADVYGASALAVVMTGMGQDGLRGCTAIRDAGGRVFVQDQASSVVWGMPGVVAQAGLADRIAPLDHLAAAIRHETQMGRNIYLRT
jgi:two-component system chemotaxis response regulator CheB